MDETNTISIVALVVSLFALFIASGQLLQQYFSTAEGSRRCKDTVIGQWSKFTRWKLIWSELRFEVHFFTPDIAILEDIECQFLKSLKTDVHAPPYIVKFLNLGEKYFPSDYREPGLVPVMLRKLHAAIDYVFRDFTSYIDQNEPHALSESNLPYHIEWSWNYQVEVSDHSAPKMNAQAMVTWLDLLSFIRAQEVSQAEEILDEFRPQGHSLPAKVVVFLRRRSWDFMPPDVVRPLASSTLGQIVIIAQRLGMLWKDLRPAEGIMRAEGHGLSFSSTGGMIHGLGTVLRFNSLQLRSLSDRRPPFSCINKAADKMSCGIIPGCRDLRIEDYPVTSEDRLPALVDLFAALNVSREVQTMDPDDYDEGLLPRSPSNDALALLAKFVPTRGSPMARVYHPIPWTCGKGWLAQATPFHFWEGRMILVKLMQEHLPSLRPSQEVLDMMAETVALKEKFHDDFFCIWSTSRLRPAIDNLAPSLRTTAMKRAIEMLATLRKLHAETSDYFQRLNATGAMNDDRNSEKIRKHIEIIGSEFPVLNYMDLVSAHVDLAFHAVDQARKVTDPNKIRGIDDAISARGIVGMAPMLELAHCYVDGLDDLVINLRTNKGWPLTDEKMKEAWWVLVMRGIAWNMSVWLEPRDQDAVVPSSLYNSQMPIWIM